MFSACSSDGQMGVVVPVRLGTVEECAEFGPSATARSPGTDS